MGKGHPYGKSIRLATAVALLSLAVSSCSIFRSRKATQPYELSPSGGYTYSYNPSWGRGGGTSTAREPSERENPFRNGRDHSADTTSSKREKGKDDRKKSLSQAEELLEYAKTFIGTPYKYGSSGPSSFDCSGFTSHVFGKFGITLERSSAAQSQKGEAIRSKDDLKPGDLVFFARSGRVFHVGIVLEKTGPAEFNFIHASTSIGVTVTSSESTYWKPKWHMGRRMF